MNKLKTFINRYVTFIKLVWSNLRCEKRANKESRVDIEKTRIFYQHVFENTGILTTIRIAIIDRMMTLLNYNLLEPTFIPNYRFDVVLNYQHTTDESGKIYGGGYVVVQVKKSSGWTTSFVISKNDKDELVFLRDSNDDRDLFDGIMSLDYFIRAYCNQITLPCSSERQIGFVG